MIRQPIAINKWLCHSILVADTIAPCPNRCEYCFTKIPGHSLESSTFDYLPREIEEFCSIHRDLKLPIRYGAKSDSPTPRAMEILAGALEAHIKHGYPAAIMTKIPMNEHERLSSAILRLADEGLIHVSVTLITRDPDLSRIWEPRAPSPERRLEFIQWLEAHDVPWTLRASPLIQGVCDDPDSFEDLLDGAPRAGHVVVELLRVGTEEQLRLALERGVRPLEKIGSYWTAPRDYSRIRFEELRKIAHERGWSFAICGHYQGYKVQDQRDCCTGEEDFYGRWWPYLAKPWYWRSAKLAIRRLRKSPLALWRDPDQNLIEFSGG